MHNYYLNIGTNLGDRIANLRRAIVALSAGTGGCGVSSVVTSKPWGFDSANDFLNVGVVVRSAMEPHDMLQWIHHIEHRLGSASHRNEQGGYVDRLVDIDIMAIDNLVIDTPELTVPHRHLLERPFFVEPMRQLNPHWVHPVTGQPLPDK